MLFYQAVGNRRHSSQEKNSSISVYLIRLQATGDTVLKRRTAALVFTLLGCRQQETQFSREEQQHQCLPYQAVGNRRHSSQEKNSSISVYLIRLQATGDTVLKRRTAALVFTLLGCRQQETQFSREEQQHQCLPYQAVGNRRHSSQEKNSSISVYLIRLQATGDTVLKRRTAALVFTLLGCRQQETQFSREEQQHQCLPYQAVGNRRHSSQEKNSSISVYLIRLQATGDTVLKRTAALVFTLLGCRQQETQFSREEHQHQCLPYQAVGNRRHSSQEKNSSISVYLIRLQATGDTVLKRTAALVFTLLGCRQQETQFSREQQHQCLPYQAVGNRRHSSQENSSISVYLIRLQATGDTVLKRRTAALVFTLLGCRQQETQFSREEQQHQCLPYQAVGNRRHSSQEKNSSISVYLIRLQATGDTVLKRRTALVFTLLGYRQQETQFSREEQQHQCLPYQAVGNRRHSSQEKNSSISVYLIRLQATGDTVLKRRTAALVFTLLGCRQQETQFSREEQQHQCLPYQAVGNRRHSSQENSSISVYLIRLQATGDTVLKRRTAALVFTLLGCRQQETEFSREQQHQCLPYQAVGNRRHSSQEKNSSISVYLIRLQATGDTVLKRRTAALVFTLLGCRQQETQFSREQQHQCLPYQAVGNRRHSSQENSSISVYLIRLQATGDRVLKRRTAALVFTLLGCRQQETQFSREEQQHQCLPYQAVGNRRHSSQENSSISVYLIRLQATGDTVLKRRTAALVFTLLGCRQQETQFSREQQHQCLPYQAVGNRRHSSQEKNSSISVYLIRLQATGDTVLKRRTAALVFTLLGCRQQETQFSREEQQHQCLPYQAVGNRRHSSQEKNSSISVYLIRLQATGDTVLKRRTAALVFTLLGCRQQETQFSREQQHQCLPYQAVGNRRHSSQENSSISVYLIRLQATGDTVLKRRTAALVFTLLGCRQQETQFSREEQHQCLPYQAVGNRRHSSQEKNSSISVYLIRLQATGDTVLKRRTAALVFTLLGCRQQETQFSREQQHQCLPYQAVGNRRHSSQEKNSSISVYLIRLQATGDTVLKRRTAALVFTLLGCRQQETQFSREEQQHQCLPYQAVGNRRHSSQEKNSSISVYLIRLQATGDTVLKRRTAALVFTLLGCRQQETQFSREEQQHQCLPYQAVGNRRHSSQENSSISVYLIRLQATGDTVLKRRTAALVFTLLGCRQQETQFSREQQHQCLPYQAVGNRRHSSQENSSISVNLIRLQATGDTVLKRRTAALVFTLLGCRQQETQFSREEQQHQCLPYQAVGNRRHSSQEKNSSISVYLIRLQATGDTVLKRTAALVFTLLGCRQQETQFSREQQHQCLPYQAVGNRRHSSQEKNSSISVYLIRLQATGDTVLKRTAALVFTLLGCRQQETQFSREEQQHQCLPYQAVGNRRHSSQEKNSSISVYLIRLQATGDTVLKRRTAALVFTLLGCRQQETQFSREEQQHQCLPYQAVGNRRHSSQENSSISVYLIRLQATGDTVLKRTAALVFTLLGCRQQETQFSREEQQHQCLPYQAVGNRRHSSQENSSISVYLIRLQATGDTVLKRRTAALVFTLLGCRQQETQFSREEQQHQCLPYQAVGNRRHSSQEKNSSISVYLIRLQATGDTVLKRTAALVFTLLGCRQQETQFSREEQQHQCLPYQAVGNRRHSSQEKNSSISVYLIRLQATGDTVLKRRTAALVFTLLGCRQQETQFSREEQHQCLPYQAVGNRRHSSQEKNISISVYLIRLQATGDTVLKRRTAALVFTLLGCRQQETQFSREQQHQCLPYQAVGNRRHSSQEKNSSISVYLIRLQATGDTVFKRRTALVFTLLGCRQQETQFSREQQHQCLPYQAVGNRRHSSQENSSISVYLIRLQATGDTVLKRRTAALVFTLLGCRQQETQFSREEQQHQCLPYQAVSNRRHSSQENSSISVYLIRLQATGDTVLKRTAALVFTLLGCRQQETQFSREEQQHQCLPYQAVGNRRHSSQEKNSSISVYLIRLQATGDTVLKRRTAALVFTLLGCRQQETQFSREQQHQCLPYQAVGNRRHSSQENSSISVYLIRLQATGDTVLKRTAALVFTLLGCRQQETQFSREEQQHQCLPYQAVGNRRHSSQEKNSSISVYLIRLQATGDTVLKGTAALVFTLLGCRQQETQFSREQQHQCLPYQAVGNRRHSSQEKNSSISVYLIRLQATGDTVLKRRTAALVFTLLGCRQQETQFSREQQHQCLPYQAVGNRRHSSQENSSISVYLIRLQATGDTVLKRTAALVFTLLGCRQQETQFSREEQQHQCLPYQAVGNRRHSSQENSSISVYLIRLQATGDTVLKRTAALVFTLLGCR